MNKPPGLDTDASIDLSAVKVGLENLHLEASYVFVDSCAVELNHERDYGGDGVRFPYGQTTDRHSSMFAFASARRGSKAYAIKDGTSVFLRDLLDLLDQGGAVAVDDDGRLVVKSYALASALARSVRHPDQHPWPEPKGENLVFHVQKNKPTGSVKVTLAPSEDAAKFDVNITNDIGGLDLRGPLSPHPYEKVLDTGVHMVELLGAKDRVCDPPHRLVTVLPYETSKAGFKAYPQ